MSISSLVDLSPIFRIMLLGIVVAGGPLTWWWLRRRSKDVRKNLKYLTWVALFLTFDLVLFGAFTRLTDSGLGCPDWPGCYGKASPFGAHAAISAAQQAMPTGPVTHVKAWIEMLHRYLATGVGVFILTIACVAWQYRWSARRASAVVPSPLNAAHWQASLTLAWVIVVGMFGALTVTMKLRPAIVTLHLIGAIFLLALLVKQAAGYGSGDAQLHGTSDRALLPSGLRWLVRGSLALVTIQIALGGWVSTNYAVLACDTFPKCQGTWWPVMNFSQGFTIWRDLGRLPDGSLLVFEALTAIHYTHRLMAYVLIPLLLLTAWQVAKFKFHRKPAMLLLLVIAAQFTTGLLNVVYGWPLIAAVLHTGGAAAMVALLVWILSVSTSPAHKPQRGRADGTGPR
jgi:cytochrome c oxidase assembly protein subunit 15